jgi:hypothetical protein
MGPFEIAAIAIVGSFIVKIVDTWMKTRGENSGAQKRILELERRIQALESGQSTKALESRLHVLEEIVTTDDFELQQKFKQLERENATSNKA